MTTVDPYRWQDDLPLAGTEFAARLMPGTTVLNGMFRSTDPDDAAVIDVAYVEPPDGDEMVIIHDVSGYTVRCCADLCMSILTPELADLIGCVVIAEQDRFALGERDV